MTTEKEKLQITETQELHVFHFLGEYGKAKEHIGKAVVIKKEIGDSKGAAADYGNLGTVFRALGQYDQAKEYQENALAIIKKLATAKEKQQMTETEELCFILLEKAKEYIEKALEVRKEIGERGGEAADYGNLGIVVYSLGIYGKAKEYTETAVVIRKSRNCVIYKDIFSVIRKEVGDKKGEGLSYGHLGTVFHSLGEYGKG